MGPGTGKRDIQMISSESGRITGSPIGGDPVTESVILPFELTCVGLFIWKLRLSEHGRYEFTLPTSMPSSEVGPIVARSPSIGAAVKRRSIEPGAAEVETEAHRGIPVEQA